MQRKGKVNLDIGKKSYKSHKFKQKDSLATKFVRSEFSDNTNADK